MIFYAIINEIQQETIEFFFRCGQEQQLFQTGQIQLLQTGGTNPHSRITTAFK